MASESVMATPSPVLDLVAVRANTNPMEMTAATAKADIPSARLAYADGSASDVPRDIPMGTHMFIIKHISAWHVLVQLLDPLTRRPALCELSKHLLWTGKKHSEFRVDLPRVVASNKSSVIATSRARDPAAKAIVAIWDGIEANMDVLKTLGMRFHVYEGLLTNTKEKKKALESIIGGFSNDAWKALNTPNLPVEAFLKLRNIDAAWPTQASDEACVYLRLYMDLPSTDGKKRFAKYGGITTQQYPSTRQEQHEAAIEAAETPGRPEARSPHYSMAKNSPKNGRHAFPMLKLTSVRPEVKPMAETTLILLRRMFHPAAVHISEETINKEITSCNLGSRMLAAQLTKIVDAELNKVNYPLFGGTGCNWACPLEQGSMDRRAWLRYPLTGIDGRDMLVLRTVSAITSVHRVLPQPPPGVRILFTSRMTSSKSQKWHGFLLEQSLEDLPGIKVGQPVIISIEVMADGKPHSTPWYRHPFVGAWDNSSELHSFAIKAEWCDESTKQWYTFPLTHGKFTTPYPRAGGDTTVTLAWRKATMILQFVHNRRYQNPPSFLEKAFNPNLKDVLYDHLDQKTGFRNVQETIVPIPKHVPYKENFRALLDQCPRVWPDTVVGRLPDVIFFGITNDSAGKASACAACKVYKKHMNPKLTAGCTKRKPFPLDSNEPDIDNIKATSCHACWSLWRRPCLWQPSRINIGTSEHYKLPPVYDGMIGFDVRPNSAVRRIEPPMNMADYEEYQRQLDVDEEDEVNLKGLDGYGEE